eukprot:12656516-Ditylum_brightwellii.AAC.1
MEKINDELDALTRLIKAIPPRARTTEEAGLPTTVGLHLRRIHMVIVGAVGTKLTRNTTV